MLEEGSDAQSFVIAQRSSMPGTRDVTLPPPRAAFRNTAVKIVSPAVTQFAPAGG
jgi:hypothetical protein